LSRIYCIYTDKEIPESESNIEHILPLSLGGSNELIIKVHKESNSRIGSKIDGKIANDFLVQLLRKKNEAKGHSKKPAVATAKNSKILSSNSPIQVNFTKNGIVLYDPKSRKHIYPNEYNKVDLVSKLRLDRFIRLRFAAKALLGAGYFIYGDTFRQKADHYSLRETMNKIIRRIEDVPSSLLGFCDQFAVGEEKREIKTAQVMNLICSYVQSSCIVFWPGTKHIVGAVGLFGTFIAGVNFQAEAKHFPNEGVHSRGHVIYFNKGKLARKSLDDVTKEIGNVLDKTET
jgi:HNH endonuclease